ncbi:MAG: hypothetical protein LBM70_05510 [Victivallales bacterium]|jgi:hypothetical protein|nr:hypothetical protein [Victivallales bacterium]
MKIILKAWLGIAALSCILSGCMQVDTQEQKLAFGALPLPEYAPIDRYKLALNLEGRRDLVAGDSGILSFSLTNLDTKLVRIPEWYSDDALNIELWCQPWFTEASGPIEELWIPIEYDWKTDLNEEDKAIVSNYYQEPNAPLFRNPLELSPGNKVFINRTLRIVKALKIADDMERRFFVKARLNLSSVNVESPVFVVTVHSAAAEKALHSAKKNR